MLDPPMLPMADRPWARQISREMVTRRISAALRRLRMRNPLVLTTLPYTDWLLGDIRQRALVYYCTDDYSFWPGADRELLQEADRSISSRADLVLAVSDRLVQLHSATSRQCFYFPHAVDYQHFSKVPGLPNNPVPLAEVPAPRIGFFGLIYEKLDFRLLARIATECAPAQVVLIGPIDYCPDWFRDVPGIHFVSKQPYDSLPMWLAGLDVLLMPYVPDEMILRSNPLKLRECLATGKPTVSIDIPEVRRFASHVRIAKDHAGFVSAVKDALAEPPNGEAARQRRNCVKNDTWECRAEQLMNYFQGLLPPTGAESR